MSKKKKNEKYKLTSDQLKAFDALQDFNRNYGKQLSEILSRASIAQDIITNLTVDTKGIAEALNAHASAANSIAKITDQLVTSSALTQISKSYSLINSQLFELNKIDLSGIANIGSSITAQLDIVNSSWSKMFEVNEQIGGLLSASIIDSLSEFNSFEIDNSLKSLTVNSNKIFNSFHSDLLELPQEVQEKVVEEIGVDESLIHSSLDRLKQIIERYGIDGFWDSRLKNKTKPKPESIAQDLSSTNLRSLLDKRFAINPQTRVGVGKVDILIDYVDHNGQIAQYLIEIKVITNVSEFEDGIEQLFEYQKISKITNATRLLFNVTQEVFEANTREINGYSQRDVIININPIPPSKR